MYLWTFACLSLTISSSLLLRLRSKSKSKRITLYRIYTRELNKVPNTTCLYMCHMQVHSSRNYIPIVKLPPKHTSLSSMMATFLTTRLIAVLQPSGYSIFHGRDTSIQLSLPWQSYSCQCLNTETSAWGNRGFITETLSISYTIHLYIRLAVTL